MKKLLDEQCKIEISHHKEYKDGILFNNWYVLDITGLHFSDKIILEPSEFEQLRIKLLTFKDEQL